MENNPALQADIDAIRNYAFKFLEKHEPLLSQVHSLLLLPEHELDAEKLDRLRLLVTSPFTLFGGDFKGFGWHVCDQVAQDGKINEQSGRILRNYHKLPSEELMAVVAEDELEVEQGNYDQFIKPDARVKFDTKQKELDDNPQVHIDIAEFFEKNPDFAENRNIIRRGMSLERGFRRLPEWYYNRNDPKSISRLEFDSLAHPYNLFGVELGEDKKYKPLLQKLSVNTTPYGIMIFIPSYWSLDPGRDIDWKEIKKVLRAWGTKRQGAKWNATRGDSDKEARAAALADDEAADAGLTGDERFDHIRTKAKLRPGIARRAIQKLIKTGRELLEAEKKK